jgi:Gpi18-like mannosyltransferase
MELRNSKKILAAILALGFLLRIYISFFAGLPNWHVDSFEYYKQADKLLAGGYTNYFPNGYPLMIAIVKSVAADRSSTVLLWLNIVLSTCTIYFIYGIARRLYDNEKIALLAAIILAVFPSQINCVRWLTTEVPSAFFLLGAFFFYYRKKYWVAGLFFGLAAVVRTNLAPVFVLLVLCELIWLKRFNARVLIAALMPVLLLASYCKWKTGEFSISGNTSINILYAVTASGGYVDYYLGDKYPEINTTGKALNMYVDHLKKNPGEYIRQRLANIWELWGCPSAANGGRGMGSRIVMLAGNLFMVIFGLYGWWKNRSRFDISVLILPFLIITGLHTFLIAIPRYTYPIEALMILLAVWTVWHIAHPAYRNRTVRASPLS